MSPTCESFKIKIAAKGPNVDEEKLQYKLHKRQATKFYDLLKESKRTCDALTVVFDMQQNQPLPKTNVTEAYYKRQLWIYNLAFVIHDGRKNRRKDRFYTWTKNQTGKGSNEVTSALVHFLKKLTKLGRRRKFKRLHLFCDLYLGQNKNLTMLAVLLCYVNRTANLPFQKVKLTFPIRGHLYLPADRVFGRVTKVLKKLPVMVSLNEYYAVYNKYAEVFALGKEWKNLYNYPDMASRMLKTTPIPTQGSRVWTFVRNSQQVKISNTYFGNEKTYSPLKHEWAGERLIACKPKVLPFVTHVTEEKIADVRALLDLVPLDEETKLFYDEALKEAAKKKEKTKKVELEFPVEKDNVPQKRLDKAVKAPPVKKTRPTHKRQPSPTQPLDEAVQTPPEKKTRPTRKRQPSPTQPLDEAVQAPPEKKTRPTRKRQPSPTQPLDGAVQAPPEKKTRPTRKR